jgi:hypothetical protein
LKAVKNDLRHRRERTTRERSSTKKQKKTTMNTAPWREIEDPKGPQDYDNIGWEAL